MTQSGERVGAGSGRKSCLAEDGGNAVSGTLSGRR